MPLASHNPTNGGNEEEEGINERDRMNRGGEWKNKKELGRFGDGWDCCLLAGIVS